MPKNETTPGRGYPLPVAGNKLNVDVERLRKALLAVDTDYINLVTKWKEFAVLAGAYLKKIDDRQDLFDEDTAEAFKQFEGRREELIRALQANHNELMAGMRGDVDAQIARLISLVPHYDDLKGLPMSAESTLPADGFSPLEYVQGLGFYRYDPNDKTPPDGEFVIGVEGGIGRWRLVLPSTDTVMALISLMTNSMSGKVQTVYKADSTLDFGTIAPGSSVTLNINLVGARRGDFVSVSPPAVLISGLSYSAFADTNIISVRVMNTTSASITPVPAIWSVAILRD